ncbi:MAG: hypothetical protein ACJAZD_002462, partial [Ilumatobacter sp.]
TVRHRLNAIRCPRRSSNEIAALVDRPSETGGNSTSSAVATAELGDSLANLST